MCYIQKGFLPTVFWGLSLLLPLGVASLFIGEFVANQRLEKFVALIGTTDVASLAKFTIGYFAILMFFPVLFSMWLSSVFPQVESRKDGIFFQYWFIGGFTVQWVEMDSLIYYENNYVVLRFKKRGFGYLLAFVNGMYFYSMNAQLLRSRLPCVILSPGLEHRDEILNEIIAKAQPMVVHKKKLA